MDSDVLNDIGEDAPIVLFCRIILQQAIGWNWYILSNITAPPGALLKQRKSVWRHSHFDPWGSIFRDSEVVSVILSDIGCGLTLTFLWFLKIYLGSFEKLVWFYVVPWCWVNNWVRLCFKKGCNQPQLTPIVDSDDNLPSPYTPNFTEILRRAMDLHSWRNSNDRSQLWHHWNAFLSPHLFRSRRSSSVFEDSSLLWT